MYQRWMKWVGLQSLTGMISRILQKFIGGISLGLAHTIYVTVVMGAVQCLGGAVITKIGKRPIKVAPTLAIGAMAFGILALANSVLSFLTFVPRNGQVGDVGVATFIITLSIIPGAIMDWAIFHHSLKPRQWMGILVAVVAGYTILGLPSLDEAKRLPWWVWLSLINALGMAANQVISQAIKDIDPWLKNFWTGLATTVAGLIVLPFTVELRQLFHYQHVTALTGFGVLEGLVILPYIFANIMAYKDGSRIAEKKLLWMGLTLISTMVMGVVIFHEAVTVWKFAGVALFCVAFVMMQKPTEQS